MIPSFGPGELIIILLIVVVIFGAGRLAEIGGALGKGIREFRTATRDEQAAAAAAAGAGNGGAKPAATTTTVAPAATPAGENKCPSCGTVNPLGQTFCGQCGTRLNIAA